MTAPLAFMAGRNTWTTVLLIGVAGSIVCWAVLKWIDNIQRTPPWYCVLQLVWLGIISGYMARWVNQCWPTAADTPLVSLVVLALAVLASKDGVGQACRAGCVLFIFLCLLYGAVIVSGSRDIKIRYLDPDPELPDAWLVAVFLLPLTVQFLPADKRLQKLPLLAIPLIATVLAVLTVGTLSIGISRQMQLPFYEFSKSLSLFGVVERFESFVCVALTVGFFSLQMVLLSASRQLSRNLWPQKDWVGFAGTVALSGGVAIIDVDPAPYLFPIISAFLWVVLPVIAGKIFREKMSKNPKKGIDI